MGFTIGRTGIRKILVLRHRMQNPAFYDIFVAWMLRHYPQVAGHFYLHDLPAPIPDDPHYALMVPWMQDPIEGWSSSVFDQLCKLQDLLRSRGIPTINRVDFQNRTIKSAAGSYFRQAGFLTPKSVRIENWQEFCQAPGLSFPFIVREDWGHRGPMWKIENEEQLSSANGEQLARPVAIEYVDTRCPDGLFRKYRYFVCGRFGVAHHLVASGNWVTHMDDRLENEETIKEELEYLRIDDPHRERFFAASRNLELDILAYDYGYNANGEAVVWEANPYPELRFGVTSTLYRNPVRQRTCRAMLAAYLEKAEIPLPEELEELLSYPVTDAEHERFAIPVDFLS